MVPYHIEKREASNCKSDPDASSTNRSTPTLLELARGIGNTPEEHETTMKHLMLNEEEPWERSLSKFLGDSASSLYSSTNQGTRKSTGVFLLEHSESRDLCSEMDHAVVQEEDSSLTLATPPSELLSIYRPEKRHIATVQDVSLMDSSGDDSSAKPQSISSKFHQRAMMYRARSTISAPSRDDRFDEARQDNRYQDALHRRTQIHICLFRQQHRNLLSSAHSFDDVTHFSEEINLPFLPSLHDDPSSIDDSNTVRRLPPRYDVENSLLVEFYNQSKRGTSVP